MKLFICGGASVSPSLIRRATDYFAQAVVTRVYGCTEVPVATIGAPRHDETGYAADTDGRAGIAEIKLVAHEAAPAGDGEICVRGPQMLLGYRHPEDDAESFDAAGFFRTGDLGRWVDDQYLWSPAAPRTSSSATARTFRPRKSRICSPTIPASPKSRSSGCRTRAPGNGRARSSCPRAGRGPDVASLLALLQSKGVAKFKAPEQVAVWDELPKNDAGKILKHRIRAVLTKMDG